MTLEKPLAGAISGSLRSVNSWRSSLDPASVLSSAPELQDQTGLKVTFSRQLTCVAFLAPREPPHGEKSELWRGATIPAT